jgi:hypothetical protein
MKEPNMRKMSRGKRLLVLAIVAPLAILVVIGIGGGLVMALWNWLMPTLFGLTQVTFWQAFGLLALCRLLFGGLRLHSSAGSRMRRRVRERWEGMTPEERERIRKAMHDRWGFGPSAGEAESR